MHNRAQHTLYIILTRSIVSIVNTHTLYFYVNKQMQKRSHPHSVFSIIVHSNTRRPPENTHEGEVSWDLSGKCLWDIIIVAYYNFLIIYVPNICILFLYTFTANMLYFWENWDYPYQPNRLNTNNNLWCWALYWYISIYIYAQHNIKEWHTVVAYCCRCMD